MRVMARCAFLALAGLLGIAGCGASASVADAGDETDGGGGGTDAALHDAGESRDAFVHDSGTDAFVAPDGAEHDAAAIDAAPAFDAAVCSLEGNWLHHVSGSGALLYLHFGADTTFYISNDPSFSELRILDRAMWSVVGTRLTIGGFDPGGTPDECETLAGVYDYVLSDDCSTVTFTLATEACDGRDSGIAVTWTRGGADVDPCLIPDGDSDTHARHTCGGDDCIDYDVATHPGATETCNGNDDDCDAMVDEGLTCP